MVLADYLQSVGIPTPLLVSTDEEGYPWVAGGVYRSRKFLTEAILLRRSVIFVPATDKFMGVVLYKLVGDGDEEESYIDVKWWVKHMVFVSDPA